MNGFVHRLLLLLASLIMHAHVASVAAQTTEQPVLARSALTDKGTSPLELRLSRQLSRTEEGALVPLDRFKECDRCPEMIVIPGGTFTMGAGADESGSTADERPKHQVAVPGFAVGRFLCRSMSGTPASSGRAAAFGHWNRPAPADENRSPIFYGTMPRSTSNGCRARPEGRIDC